MALNAYLRLTGQKQGPIKGSVTQKGREDSIMVFACTQGIESPRDPASGTPTGKRMHKPVVISKEVDISSPLLWNALVNNENISTWTLQFFTPQVGNDRTTGVGVENQYYTVTLTNASIAGIEFIMANNKDPELMKIPLYEEVSFVYQKIEWTWVKGGIMSADDWETPAS